MAKIIDCSNQMVLVSAHSITIKDECDKTRGLIRNVDNLYDLSPNKQFPLARKIEQAGLSRDKYFGFCNELLIVDGEFYVLVDDYSLGVEERSKAMAPEYYTPSKHVQFWQACESCPLVTVIHCKRVFMSKTRK